MLIPLPNGDWINPQDVVSVVAQGAVIGRRVRFKPRVTVTVKMRDDIAFLTETYDQAAVLRDQLAEQVNTACVVGGQRC